MTDNHGYETPKEGRADWHIPLNDNFKQIDTGVEIRDLESNRDSYVAKKGSKFLATDTESAFVGDGENWVRLSSRGNNASFESINTDKASINGDIFAASEDRSGALIIDGDEYRAISFVTEESWTDPDDAGTVLQSLLDALRETAPNLHSADNTRGIDKGDRTGKIVVGPGTFPFQTTVVLDNHRGTTIEGQSFMQSNQWSSTVFLNKGIDTGRGILEFGNIGGSSGGSAGCHIKNITLHGNGGDIFPLYNWRQDRIRLTDVRSRGVGPNGHGIVQIGAYNVTWQRVRCLGAAVLDHTDTNGTNQLDIIGSIFNAPSSDTPPFVAFGDGWNITTTSFKTGEFGGLDSGVKAFSGDVDDQNVSTSDSRINKADLSTRAARITFRTSSFSGGRHDSSASAVGDGIRPDQCKFVQCTFIGERAITDPTQSNFTGCEIRRSNQGVVYNSGTQAQRTVFDGCKFYNIPNEHIILSSENAKGFMLTGNLLTPNPDYSSGGVLIDSVSNKHKGVLIANNYIDGDINANYVGGSRDNSGSDARIVNNYGYNPVGYAEDRPAFSPPSSNTEWVNKWAQPVLLQTTGDGSGVTRYDDDGNSLNSSTGKNGDNMIDSSILDAQNMFLLDTMEGIEWSTPPSDGATWWF